MAIDLNQGVNDQFNAQRNRAAQQEAGQLQRQRDALARRQAALGGAPGGAFIKQEQLAGDESANRLQQANEGIDAAQTAENRRIREIQQGQEFARSERLGSQDFTAGQSAIQRKYQTEERLGSQDFSHGERLSSQDFTASENAKQIQAAHDQQIAAINAAASEGRLNREQQMAALNQAQKQFEQSLDEEKRVNDFNMKQKDPLEKLLDNAPGMGGIPQIKGYLGQVGISTPSSVGIGGTTNAITRRLGLYGETTMAQAQKRPGLSQQVLPMAGQAAGAAFTGGSPEGAMVGGMIGTKLAGGDATPTGGSGAADAIARRLKGPQEAPPSDPSQDLAKADAALSYLPPEQQQKYAPIISRARALDAQSAQGGWR